MGKITGKPEPATTVMTITHTPSKNKPSANRAISPSALLAVCLILPHTHAAAQTPTPTPPVTADPIDALTAKGNPTAGDWPTEILHVHAKHRLKRLAQRLIAYAATGDPADLHRENHFTPHSRVDPLRPAVTDVLTRRSLRVRRATRRQIESGVPTRPADALTALMQPFRAAANLRIAFKIIGLTPRDEHTFTTTVLYQAFGRPAAGPTQQNARWTITWNHGPHPNHPLIQTIRVDAFHDAVSTQTPFTECTRSVITDDVLWREQLLRGGEHWYGKIDAVGEIHYLGHQGIAVGDVNGDGLDDLYVAMGTGIPNKLLVQQPDGTVRDLAHRAGVAWLDDTKGVLLVDLDNDGDQDLLCAMGPSIVYCRNDGTGLFTPLRKLRAATNAAFYSITAADYDLDGDLDLYATRYVKTRYGHSVPIPFHDAENGPPNHLLRNDGPSGFTDVTRDLGLNVHNTRFSLAAAWADYDGDGDPDLYVANDFGRNNLYRNDGDRFLDVAAASGTEDQAAGMGVSWSDYDLDGDLDLCVSNMFSSAGQRIAYQPRFKPDAARDLRRQIQHHSLGNALFANSGDGTFNDVSDSAGIRMGRWAWGAEFVDFDNDGFDDLIVPNGFLTNERTDDL